MSEVDALASIRALVGAEHCRGWGDAPAAAARTTSADPPRPLAVAPASTREVSEVVRRCHDARIAVVPVGGETGLVDGTMPAAGRASVLLSLRRLDRFRRVTPELHELVCEAGCVLADVQRAAEAVDLYFPLSLGASGSCQVGGNLATNAGGMNVVRYGMARRLVLGLEVVLPSGAVLDAVEGPPKSNTGYDLKQLFVGSEGTLGVITAARLRLFPALRTSVWAMAGVSGVAGALTLLQGIEREAADLLTLYELIPHDALRVVLARIPGTRRPLPTDCGGYVLVQFASTEDGDVRARVESLLDGALGAGVIQDVVLASNAAQAREFLRLRETIPEAIRGDGALWKFDVATPRSRLESFVHTAERATRELLPDAVTYAFGHLADGNLHFEVSVADAPAGAHEALTRTIHDLVVRHAGTISAEHGIGALRRREFARLADPVALGVMRAVKQALDPRGIMNPGKVL